MLAHDNATEHFDVVDDRDALDADARLDAENADVYQRLEQARTARDQRMANAGRTRTDASDVPSSRMMLPLGEFDEATRSVPIVASTTDNVYGERLLTWDLAKFLRNPIVLWSHKGDELPIGRAEEVDAKPEGLKMRVFFASEKASPMAEHVVQCIREKILRAVSVGFEPGPAKPGVDGVVERTGNVLIEVSFVTAGKDPNAGTPALNPDAASGGASRAKRFMMQDSDGDPIEERTDADEDLDRVMDDARARRDATMANAWRTER